MSKRSLQKELTQPLTFLDIPKYEYVNGVPIQTSERRYDTSEEGLDPGPPTKVDGGTFITYRNLNYSHTKPTKAANLNFKVTKPKVTEKKIASDDSSKKHTCPFEHCQWSFLRQSDLTRHMKSHQEPKFHCPYWKHDPSCHRNGGSFNRLDVLKRHLKLVHFVKDRYRQSEKYASEDSGWCRSCQRMFPNAKTFIDHCTDCANSSDAQ